MECFSSQWWPGPLRNRSSVLERCSSFQDLTSLGGSLRVWGLSRFFSSGVDMTCGDKLLISRVIWEFGECDVLSPFLWFVFRQWLTYYTHPSSFTQGFKEVTAKCRYLTSLGAQGCGWCCMGTLMPQYSLSFFFLNKKRPDKTISQKGIRRESQGIMLRGREMLGGASKETIENQ